MVERSSNSEFLMVEPRLPTEASGWEVKVISPHDWRTVIGYVRNWRKISGSKSLNDFGGGSIELNVTNPILSTPFPAGVSGTLRSGEFLWQFWRDGILRHEWISDDDKENEVSQGSTDNVITFNGRGLEKVLEWAIHRPIWGERQAYSITGQPTGGSYTLTVYGDVTGPIAWNATPEQVHTALWTSINQLGPNDFTVTSDKDWYYSIQFIGRYAGRDVPRIQMHDNNLTAEGTQREPDLDIPEPNSDNTWEDLNSTILGKTAATSVLAFLDRATSRGVLTFLTPMFSTTHDSNGQPWTDITDVTCSPGETLLAMLQRLSDMNQWEFKVMSGFKLWIAQNTYGVDRRDQVVFYKSGHQQVHERASSSRDVITDAYVQSAKYDVVHTSTSTTVTPWKREAWIEAGGAPSVSAANAVANATLQLRRNKRVSRTITVPPELKTRKVFIDYDLSDIVTLETASGMEPIKVVGLGWSSTPDAEFGLELTIQSAFEMQEVRVQRALDKLGAKAATGGAGSSPTGPAPISRTVSMRELTDVNLAGVTEGDVLVRKGGKWVRKQPVLDFLTNVDVASVSNGQALIFDSTLGKWKAGAPTVSLTVDWTSVQNKPSTFPPATHTHTADGISDATTVGKSLVRAADAAAARAAIGAGTGSSNLALGTTGSTAKAGNYVPAWSEITSKPTTFEPIVKGADWLSDVDTTTAAPTNGQALVWNQSLGLWKPGTVAAGSSNIDALTDVDTSTTAPTNGQALVWDSATSLWKPATVAGGGGATNINGLSDVDTATVAPTDRQVLKWDATTSQWRPSPVVDPSVTFQTGDITSSTSDTGNVWASAITNLTVRSAFTLTRLDFWAVDSGTYALYFNGSQVGSSVTVTGGTTGSFTGLSLSVPAGTHTIGLTPTGSKKIRYKSLTSITYSGTGYDMTASGWTALAGTYTIPFIYYGQAPNPSTLLDALADVNTASVTSGQVLGFDGTEWVPYNAIVQQVGAYPSGPQPTKPATIIGDTTGVNTTDNWTKAATNLTVRVPGRLTKLSYLNLYVTSQSLWIDGVKVGASYTPSTSDGFWNIDVWLNIGVHTVEVRYDSGGSLPVHYRAVASIDYIGFGVDMTAATMTGDTTKTPPFQYTFAPAVDPEAGVAVALGELEDVAATAATDGQLLTWNSTTSSWGPEDPEEVITALSGLSDVAIGTPTHGDMLSWDNTAGKWVPVPNNPVAVSDTAPSSPSTGMVWFDIS